MPASLRSYHKVRFVWQSATRHCEGLCSRQPTGAGGGPRQELPAVPMCFDCIWHLSMWQPAGSTSRSSAPWGNTATSLNQVPTGRYRVDKLAGCP